MTPLYHLTRAELIRQMTIEEGDCWIWQGPADRGRPTFEVRYPDGKRRRVAARMWLALLAGDAKAQADEARMLAGQPWKGVWVATCGNPRCVAPEHVQRITQQQHMSRAGRSTWANAASRAVATERIAVVARERRGVLSPEQVAQLPALVAQHGTQRKAAAELGVSQATVSWLLARHRRQALRPGGVWGGLVR